MLRGQYDGESSHAFSGKLVQLGTSLNCLYTHGWSVGNKQEELEVHVQLQGYHLIGTAAIWWDSSHKWSAAIDGYRLFKKDGRGR